MDISELGLFEPLELPGLILLGRGITHTSFCEEIQPHQNYLCTWMGNGWEIKKKSIVTQN